MATSILRAGLEAVFAASAKRATIIGKNSLLPEIAVTMYADTPWSTWRPEFPKPLVDQKAAQRLFGEPALTWVHLALLDEMKKTKDIKTHTKFKAGQFALQIGVPRQTIETAIFDLTHLPSNFPTNNIPREFRNLPVFSRRKNTGKRPHRSKA